MYGIFLWAYSWALKNPKRRFPARAVLAKAAEVALPALAPAQLAMIVWALAKLVKEATTGSSSELSLRPDHPEDRVLMAAVRSRTDQPVHLVRK